MGDLERTIKKPENSLYGFFIVNFISLECRLPSALLIKVLIHKLKQCFIGACFASPPLPRSVRKCFLVYKSLFCFILFCSDCRFRARLRVAMTQPTEREGQWITQWELYARLCSWAQDQPCMRWKLNPLLLVKVKLQQGLGTSQFHQSSPAATATPEHSTSSGLGPRVRSHPYQSKAKKIGLTSASKVGKILL